MESSDDKPGGPPVLVRREKRSSSTPPVDTSLSPSPSNRHDVMQHVYPDVIIIDRATRDMSRDTALVRYDDDDDNDKTLKLCDVTDDDVNASLKDYTFMYKKDDNADKKLIDQTDACSDISSVSSSIVDYVRRSLTEVGVSTTSGESRDERPPPLPVKTTTQRRAPLHCEIHGQQDDVITSTWEPTHMTWDEVLNEAQMLGIPLQRSTLTRARRSSTSPVSHRSSPASSPAVKPHTVTSERVRHQRGSSTPSRLDREPTDNRSESKRTNKFNIRNLLAKIAVGRTSPTTQSNDTTTRVTRRSLSQPEQQRHSKRSLSASAPLRRARINDSTSSISGASTISQYYPTAVAHRLSPSPARCRTGTTAVRVGTSLRSSSGSVWTSPDSLPDSVSTNSLGSVFSLKSSSTGASPALWTPFSPPHTGSPGCSASPSHGGSTDSRSETKRHLASNMQQLKNCGWYWGAIGWEEAEKQLESERDGSFLLRDSSDDRYLFSLSFRALDTTHHTRIEHYKGSFSFSAQTLHNTSSKPVAASSIVDFIQQAMIESHRCTAEQPIFSLQPRPPRLNAIPVRLLYPVSRFTRTNAQH